MNISVYLVVLEIIACMYFLPTMYYFPDKLIKEKVISHKMLNLAKYEYFPRAFYAQRRYSAAILLECQVLLMVSVKIIYILQFLCTCH